MFKLAASEDRSRYEGLVDCKYERYLVISDISMRSLITFSIAVCVNEAKVLCVLFITISA